MGRPEGAIVVWQRGNGRTGAGRWVRLALAALLVAVMLPVAAPSAMGAADDDFPGVPIPASPITGTLDDTLDHGDLFAVDLQAGQSITVALKGPDTADFDLYLYPPGTTSWESAIDVAYSWSMSSVELLTWVAETPGTYYLEVFASSGAGSYTAAWRIEDEEPGLSAYPLEGLGRVETAIGASREVFWAGSEYVIIATARSFPDALGGSALAGMLDAPILLTEPTYLPPSVATEIVEELGASKVIILGGTGAVS